MRKQRWYERLALTVMGICLLLGWVRLPVASHAVFAANQPIQVAQSPAQSGQALYEAGQFHEAKTVLQQALQTYQQQGDQLQQALTLSNLALVYQQLGQWQAANQAIEEGMSLLEQSSLSPAATQVLAQALNIRGRLQLAQGHAESALTSWQQAADLYAQLNDSERMAQAQLNQAQALQALGLYRRAIELLTALKSSLPDRATPLKITVLRSLGDALQVSGDLSASRHNLEQALQQLTEFAAPQPELTAALQLSLANLTRAEATAALSRSNLSANTAILALTTSATSSISTSSISTPSNLVEASRNQRRRATAQLFVRQLEAALQLYQQAANLAVLPATRIQSQLGQLTTLIELQRWAAAEPLIVSLQSQLASMPLDQNRLYQQINLGLSWLKLGQGKAQESVQQESIEQESIEIDQSSLLAIQQLLRQAAIQAADFDDPRTQSFALGSLGEVNRMMQNWTAAEQATEQALMLSQAIRAADLSYRWQWQLGRLLKRNDRTKAILAYTEAVRNLQALRNDLVAINRDVQFSFQAQVEPVYRELVDLLLSPDQAQIPVAQLVQAREVIEGLQIAELDNFFREACLETQFEIDQVIDREQLSAAVFYTIMLPDRLEVILKLPEQNLIHYTTPVSQSQLEATVDELLAELKRPYLSQQTQILAKQVYDWLIAPVDAHLNGQVETLVFLLDGALRNLPIATLYDGEQFLIQKYSLALAPGLQLADPKPLQERRFNVLAAGLSEARANFAPLNFVQQEIQQIQTELPSRVLFNQTFTPENLQKQLAAAAFSIVHIATHGQFSSNAAETFILAWDRPILVNELSDLLQIEEVTSPQPIELLVLSACRTAVGDQRATLGMAGVAVRAGARSTIASLWNLDDDSGAALMDQFYQALVQPVSKAEALRRAQLALLENPRYAAPRFWAPYVLLGNWL
ncbi:MAG: CHAT domain-containing protein [Cyanobacteria bacterium RM1_2_2]|nr:CHAT domain-containing protein [Cyanobacteria bacterium RM1_2_2]